MQLRTIRQSRQCVLPGSRPQSQPMIPRFYTNAIATEHYLGIRWPVAIWRAVLEQAVRDLLGEPAVWETRGLSETDIVNLRDALRAAAAAWVSDDANEPRRFVWVCELLELEPDAVRRSIESRLPRSER